MSMNFIQRWSVFQNTADLVTAAKALGLDIKIDESADGHNHHSVEQRRQNIFNEISTQLDLIIDMMRRQELQPCDDLFELNDVLLRLFLKYENTSSQ